ARAVVTSRRGGRLPPGAHRARRTHPPACRRRSRPDRRRRRRSFESWQPPRLCSGTNPAVPPCKLTHPEQENAIGEELYLLAALTVSRISWQQLRGQVAERSLDLTLY